MIFRVLIGVEFGVRNDIYKNAFIGPFIAKKSTVLIPKMTKYFYHLSITLVARYRLVIVLHFSDIKMANTHILSTSVRASINTTTTNSRTEKEETQQQRTQRRPTNMNVEALAKLIAIWMMGGMIILLTSGLILAQCCCKKKAKKEVNKPGAKKNEEGKNDKKNNKKKKEKTKNNNKGKEKEAAAAPPDKKRQTGPNPRLNEPRGNEGIGEGEQYQTLGGVDRDIFARGQVAGKGIQPTPIVGHPKVPHAAAVPNAIDDTPHGQQGTGDGVQYQTLGNLDTNDIFAKGQAGGGQQPAHQGSIQAPPEAGGPGDAPSVNDGPIREGIGQGADYQTWVNLDQDLFVQGQQQEAPAMQQPEPQPEEQSNVEEAAPREGIGQGADYQTWNNLDQNVFLKK